MLFDYIWSYPFQYIWCYQYFFVFWKFVSTKSCSRLPLVFTVFILLLHLRDMKAGTMLCFYANYDIIYANFLCRFFCVEAFAHKRCVSEGWLWNTFDDMLFVIPFKSKWTTVILLQFFMFRFGEKKQQLCNGTNCSGTFCKDWYWNRFSSSRLVFGFKQPHCLVLDYSVCVMISKPYVWF